MQLYTGTGRIKTYERPIPYEELPELYLIENKLITSTGPHPYADDGDGITIFGPGHVSCQAKKTLIRNVIIDFTAIPPESQDEGIAGVHGAVVDMENVVIIGAKKAVLCGNGDHPELDATRGFWNLRNVAFINCGRRCPEVQDGVTVYASNILIENWGSTFDVRSFGMWSHTGAYIYVNGLLLLQDRVFDKNFFIDLGNHIGQAFNERDKNPLDYITPGRLRGAVCSDKGSLDIYNVYTSSPFIRTKGSSDVSSKKGRYKARNILNSMTQSFLKNRNFYSYVTTMCRNSALVKGIS